MLSSKDISLVKSILGDDVFETMEKSEISGGLYKKNTKTALDPEEIRIALEIVPRTILSFLMSCLKHKEEGHTCSVDLPFAPGAKLECYKLGPDNYSGEIIKEGKVCAEFKHRSIPGIGLIILTTFELYDVDKLEETKAAPVGDKTEKLQALIDDRLELNRLVRDVVDRRIAERTAIDMMIRHRLHNHIIAAQVEQEKPEEENKEEEKMDSKKSRLRQFLEKREEKRKEKVQIDKSEVKCPDCKSTLYKNEYKNKINLCICYGDNMNKDIKFVKSENGKVNFKFPKSFDIEDVEMLLDAMKK